MLPYLHKLEGLYQEQTTDKKYICLFPNYGNINIAKYLYKKRETQNIVKLLLKTQFLMIVSDSKTKQHTHHISCCRMALFSQTVLSGSHHPQWKLVCSDFSLLHLCLNSNIVSNSEVLGHIHILGGCLMCPWLKVFKSTFLTSFRKTWRFAESSL